MVEVDKEDSDDYTIVENMFEGLMMGSKPFPWYVKVGWWFSRHYESVSRYFKRKYEKITLGFMKEEAWSFNYYHSQWVLPRLKHLRDNLHGHPAIIDAPNDEWGEIIDKMIWSFENFDETIEPNYSDDYDHRLKMSKVEGGIQFTPMNKTGVVDYTPQMRHDQKVEEGLMLFAMYYKNLWD